MKVTKVKGLNRIWLDHLHRGLGRCESVISNSRAFYADKMDRSCWALFFGDFLLSQQKKVTRPPGRIPGAALREAKQQHQALPPLINDRFSISTRNTIANAMQFIRIADPP
jgi:hypothetical protein